MLLRVKILHYNWMEFQNSLWQLTDTKAKRFVLLKHRLCRTILHINSCLKYWARLPLINRLYKTAYHRYYTAVYQNGDVFFLWEPLLHIHSSLSLVVG